MASKSKEKRAQRLKETEALNARKALVDNANKVDDYLEGFDAFRKINTEGLQLELQSLHSGKVSDDLRSWMFQLAKDNMQHWYQTAWGWTDSVKLNELKDEDARFLVAFESTSRKPKAFMHFRFVFENEIEVLYVYELQAENDIRSKGVGRLMMKLSELIAIKYQMKKVVLTCFTKNDRAIQFYLSKLNYEIDEISPSKSIQENEITYEILCRKLPQKK